MEKIQVGLEFLLLRALARLTVPVTQDDVKGVHTSPFIVRGALEASFGRGLVTKTWNGSEDMWSITPQGRVAFSAWQTELGALADEAPQASRCHPRAEAEPDPVSDPIAPNVAIACISESDLDDWWHELDVERKADVFLLETLGTGLRLHDCPAVRERLRIPVEGTVNAGAVAQGDGCGEDSSLDQAQGTMLDEMHGGAR